MAHYLYGLVREDAAAPPEPGVGGQPVSVHPLGRGIAVLASDLETVTIQPRRTHLTAHDRVLAAAMSCQPILPLRFGVITEGDPHAILDEIDPPAVLARMRDLSGKVEVQVLWEPDGDVALRRVAERRPDVRDRTIDRVDRGRMIADAIAVLAVEDLTRIRDELADLIAASEDVEARGSGARVATLVEVDLFDDLISRCDGIAERVAPAGRLRTVGALPPYSFAATEPEPAVT